MKKIPGLYFAAIVGVAVVVSLISRSWIMLPAGVALGFFAEAAFGDSKKKSDSGNG